MDMHADGFFFFFMQAAMYYYIFKLLSLLIFLIIFDNLSYIKNLKFCHRICYDFFINKKVQI
jgi:hypothetical protein